MPLQRVPINNFRGGLNTRDGPFDLQPNESPDLMNVTLTSLVGSLQMRAGKTRFDVNSPANPVDHCRMAVLNNVHWLMCSINGAIYSCDQGGNFTLLFTGAPGTIWDFAQMPDAAGADKVWCSNGADAPQKWDGVAASTSAWAGTPPKLTRFLVWNNKIVGINAKALTATLLSTLFVSKFGDPELTTGAYDTLQLRGDDDELGSFTEIQVLANRLYVFKQRSTWIVNDPVTFANRRLGEPGCSGHFQSDACEEKLYFFNEQGLWSTGGVAIALESGSITNYFPQNLNYSAISKVRVVATRDSYPRVLLAVPLLGSLVNNILIELVPHINFRRIGGRRYLLLPAFMLHSFSAASLAPYKPGASATWGIYGGDAGVNKVYQYFNGTTDDGAAISSKWQSAWMTIQGEEPLERIRRVNVELLGDAIVDIFRDFNPSPDFSATLPNPNPSTSDLIWDNAPHTWDEVGAWDPPSTYRFARLRPESRGRFHSVRFRSLPGGQPFSINVAEFAVRGGKEH